MRAHSRYGHKSQLTNILFKAKTDHATRVIIADGALSEIDRILAQCHLGKRLAILCQPSTKAMIAEPAMQLLHNDFTCHLVELPDGEPGKDQEQLLYLWGCLQQFKFDRSDCIVAIGGGSLSDIAGFAASTYLRGIRLVLVPTTLLAQVDAAIGGKTGINLKAGKNLAGSFYFPTAVIADPALLKSLPMAELRSGLGEIIKYALIEETVAAHTEYRTGPAALFRVLEQMLANGSWDAGASELSSIISACIRMKLSVVAIDPTELGLRRCLNLGHTLGHAIEKVSNFAIRHGEAVSIGCAFASRLAENLTSFPKEETARLVGLLKKAQLPHQIPADLPADALVTAMAYDKKREGDAIKLVLPTNHIGQVSTDISVSYDRLRSAL